MDETPSGPTIDPRLRDYLDAELRRAEADFARIPLPTGRGRTIAPLATLLATGLLLLVVAVAGSQLLGRSNTGPASVQLGADGLPTSIDGQPVLRTDAITAAAASGRSFLAAGELVLATAPCPSVAGSGAAASKSACSEGWRLVDPAAWAPAFGLSGAAGASGFVHTAGALTVIRAHGLGQPSPSGTTCEDCGAVLNVEQVVWRQPTKGPIPESATDPATGQTYDALVPDFVATVGHGTTVVGYVPKTYLIGPMADLPGSPANPPQPAPMPVYGEDLTTLVGHMVAEVGFVPIGVTATPAGNEASVAPSTVGPPSTGPASSPFVDCGRIATTSCEQAVALARAGHAAELAGATAIAVDDLCAPSAACDRFNPFDAAVVFVTAGADRAGWIAFEVTGPGYSNPTKAARLVDALPAHIAQQVSALVQRTTFISPSPAPTPLPSFRTSPPPGRLTWFEAFAFSADGRTLTLRFTGGPAYTPSDPCSIAYAGWAEAAGDTLYVAVVDVTDHVRPSDAPTPQACDTLGHGRSVTIDLASPFTGSRLVDLAGYVHFLRAPAGLVELTGLPAAWTLRSERDVQESPTGRWLRVYSPAASPPEGSSRGRLELYQSFGAPVEVTGGEEVRAVSVNGQAATLYRSAADGELVLVWSLGGDGLALVANEADFGADALIKLAESARLP